MNVPFVKVNNQQEFDRVVDKMQRETGLKSHHSTNGYDSVFSALGVYNYEGEDWIFMLNPNHYENKHLKIISADEYLTGVRTNFTLSDLKNGMVVELRDYEESFYLVLFNRILGLDTYDDLEEYNEDFTAGEDYPKLDIVKVYSIVEVKSLSANLSKDNLTLIFDAEAHRNKLTIEQKKADIKSKIYELNKQLEELK